MRRPWRSPAVSGGIWRSPEASEVPGAPEAQELSSVSKDDLGAGHRDPAATPRPAGPGGPQLPPCGPGSCAPTHRFQVSSGDGKSEVRVTTFLGWANSPQRGGVQGGGEGKDTRFNSPWGAKLAAFSVLEASKGLKLAQEGAQEASKMVDEILQTVQGGPETA